MGQNRAMKGFSVIGIIAVIVAVLAMGATGWYVWQKNQGGESTQTNNTPGSSQRNDNTNAEEKQDIKWVAYKNKEAKITFEYPVTWKHEEGKTEYFEEGARLGQVTGAVTAPSGKKLEWVYAVWGGKGGSCTPGVEDVPFAQGNICSSKQIISNEKLPPLDGPNNPLLRNPLHITKTKYRSSGDLSGITYQICLDPMDEGSADSSKPGVRMNLLFPCEFWSTGFNAKFQVDNEEDFNSEESRTAEAIMRSFDTL